jgi:polyhydroxyalkanoate synthesis regulator phasin
VKIGIEQLFNLVSYDDADDFREELGYWLKTHESEVPYIKKLKADLREMEDSRDDEERQKNELKDDLERTREELDELKARVAGLEK